ncbi:MMPL family transporter [Staphylococcus caeli]|uniref:RND superfamily drug exporter n=1 Tax=Staphylococcus caeli TaxID=2201815 RepID=A0A1D4HRS3_9STAP|nr:MMPL family transporter [Staphylococcus caeli]SCS39814.1 RND superfamily drug exporter [Staphylococcus caeli]SCS58181.1 RND superfamily drug exporter [Staphylococcus caeli]
MAKFLYKLGSFIAKHKWWSVIAWVVLLAAIIIPLTVSAPKFDNDITMNGLQSLDTNKKIEDEFNQDSEKAQIRVVFKSDSDNGIVKQGITKDIKNTLKDIKDDDKEIKNISDPYENKQISKDKTTAFADINYDVSATSMTQKSKDNVQDKVNQLEDDHNVNVELMGTGMESTEMGGSSELIGIIVAFVVLLVTFGSFIAAGMPIISALLGLGTGVGIISLLTYAFDIPNVTLTLSVMIGLAVGIDYALFILFRYRQIMKTETNHIKAVGLAVGTAGSAVIFAGVTVIIAVCGLSLVGIDFLAVMGFASAISVLVAVLSALTLLPALISIFHKQIKPKHTKSEFDDDVETKWSKFVVGKPLAAVLIGLIILVVAAIPISNMRLGIPDDGMKPEDSTQKQAYEIISDKFGEGYNGQIAMLVNVKDQKDNPQALQRDLQALTKDINKMDNVDMATPPQLSENKDYALVAVIPEKGPNAESTNDLVHDLRDYNKDAKDKYGFKTEVSGQSVINIDMSQKLNEAIPLFAGVIVALAFILLMVVFRSIIIPLKAVLGFVLSLVATLGFTTLIMQEGFMSSLFGVDTTGPLLAFLPVIAIGLLFGLAMDYEVFLMSRIHEEYSKTHNNEHSIKVGIKESGPVVVAAALIMFSVFIAFVFQDDVMIKSMGIALGFGVLFDAFVVRLLLIPALTQLFGKASWYIPSWLNRILPQFDIEGHALQDQMPSSRTQSTSKQVANETYDRSFSIQSQTKASQSKQFTIHTDEKTHILYNEIAHQAVHTDFLYQALKDYQMDMQQSSQQLAKNKSNDDDDEQMNDKDIYALLMQQSENIRKLNELIEYKIKNK